MEYKIIKCGYTYSKDKKSDLASEAFNAAGFSHKEADEYLEIDHIEKLFTKDDITVRFILMDKPDELMFMFQYHVFESYGDEIARKKKKMKEVHLQKQKELSNPVKNTRIEAINKEVIQENPVITTASIKTVEVDKQLIIAKEEKYDESLALEIMNHEVNDDVPEGQYSLFVE